MGAGTTADNVHWQGVGAQLVTEFIALGGRNDLPPLNWSIDLFGDVHGEVPESEEDSAAVFEQWCRLLGAVDLTSSIDTSCPVTRTVSRAWVRTSVRGLLALDRAVRDGACHHLSMTVSSRNATRKG